MVAEVRAQDWVGPIEPEFPAAGPTTDDRRGS